MLHAFAKHITIIYNIYPYQVMEKLCSILTTVCLSNTKKKAERFNILHLDIWYSIMNL